MKTTKQNEALDERVMAGVHKASYSSYKVTQFLLLGWMFLALLLGWEEQLWAPLLIFGLTGVWFQVQLVREGVMGGAGKPPKGQSPYSLKRILRLGSGALVYWLVKTGLDLWYRSRDGAPLWDSSTPGLILGNLALAIIWLAFVLGFFKFIAYMSNKVVERKIRRAEESQDVASQAFTEVEDGQKEERK